MLKAPEIKIHHDGPITVYTGTSRKAIRWKPKETSWSDWVERCSRTKWTGETVEQFKRMSKKERDDVKDIGGFVGATLKGGRRTKESVAWRHLLTLDADYADETFWEKVKGQGFACLVYSTHSHAPPERHRYRLIAPLGRAVDLDEYQAVARKVAEDIGIDTFDDTSYEPNRLMYYPSTPIDGEFFFKVNDAPWIDPDKTLDRYTDWRDAASWPQSSREVNKIYQRTAKLKDPRERQGIVGVFNQAFTVHEAIEKFLPDIYEPSEDDDTRYTFVGGSSHKGLKVLDDGLWAYSHHGTDPAGGYRQSAFDLVRLHKFGELDEETSLDTPMSRRPSYTAMKDFAREQEEVLRVFDKQRLEQAGAEFQEEEMEWMTQLNRNRKGEIDSTIWNVELILRNDPELAGKIKYNELSHQLVYIGDLPWAECYDTLNGVEWTDADDAKLWGYIERIYGIDHKTKITAALDGLRSTDTIHPLRDYLNGLEWDGVERLDTLFIDYMGAEDNVYTRAAARKSLTGAVARIFEPGVKFDYAVVFYGDQGVGKSAFIRKLGMEWTLELDTFLGKDAAERLHGKWLVEIEELTAFKRSEVEQIKGFISRNADHFRKAYDRRAKTYPRQNVFFGTTNDPEYLKDDQNRRFWGITVRPKHRKKDLFKDLTPEVVGQVWAEAVVRWKEGEPLYMEDPEAKRIAEEVQLSHREEDPRFGMIQQYLDQKLPEDWDLRDIQSRKAFIHDFSEGDNGTVERTRVCLAEIWVELFQKDIGSMPKRMAWELTSVMKRMPDWKPYGGKLRFGPYGPNRAYVRVGSEDDPETMWEVLR